MTAPRMVIVSPRILRAIAPAATRLAVSRAELLPRRDNRDGRISCDRYSRHAPGETYP